VRFGAIKFIAPQSRHNRAIIVPKYFNRTQSMSASLDSILKSIQLSTDGIGAAELLKQHPGVSKRTLQRQISIGLAKAQIVAVGHGRARRYVARVEPSSAWEMGQTRDRNVDHFPSQIPVSVDSQDILEYVDMSLEARKPVGYQSDFLHDYKPNETWYLSPSLRLQLKKMGSVVNAVQPAGTYSRGILGRLLVDLSWASSHLEGNTYSLLDTRNLLEQGKVARGKATSETQMILNHRRAIELLVENMETAEFNRYTLMNLHSTLAENLLPNASDEGRIRQHAVDIGKSMYRPLSTPQQIDTELDLLLSKARLILDPFEQSFFLMVHLSYLQPFADVNKRTSRLMANLPLFRANLCPLTFLGVPESAYSRATLGVYEMTRVELLRDLYVWAYERSTQEYLAIKKDVQEPDPQRLIWREFIKETIQEVIQHPNEEPLVKIVQRVTSVVPLADQSSVQALVVEELSRLHLGSLARYGLRPSEFLEWKSLQEHGLNNPSGEF